ncbi:hypothetical protein K502DRAFT_324133 [Neoconidiobolus thromboides FSU 785]|nr:hypothetical protein K502DRAFT_324133 [Neoconidiobolus thromboides FSU 785]
MTQESFNSSTKTKNKSNYDDDSMMYYPKNTKSLSNASSRSNSSFRNNKNGLETKNHENMAKLNSEGHLNNHKHNGISHNHSLGASLNTHNEHNGDNDHSHNHSHSHNVHNHTHDHSHDHSHDHDHNHNHDHSHEHNHNHDHSHGHGHKHDHSHDHGHDHSENGHILDSFDGQILNLPSFNEAFRDKLSFYQLIMRIGSHQSNHCKRLLQFTILQTLLGFFILTSSIFVESLALAGIGYVTIFDSLGLANSLLAKLTVEPSISDSSNVYPYGLKRFEIVVNFVTVIYGLFASINMIKEGLETLLLGEFDHSINPSTLFLGYGYYLCIPIIINIFVYLATMFPYRTHGFFAQLRFQKNKSTSIKHLKSINSFIVSSLFFSMCSLCLLTNNTFGFHPEFFDSMISLMQAIVLLYLTTPLSIRISMILMHTLPSFLQSPVKKALNDVTSLPFIDRYDNLHIWQNGYGEFMGTVQIFAHANVNLNEIDPLLLSSPFKGVIDQFSIELTQ